MRNLFISILIPVIVLIIPIDWIPIAGITIIEQRVLAIFVMAILFWVLEPIPVFATSVVIVTSELLMISNKGLTWFRSGAGAEGFGVLLPYQPFMKTFSSPIIMLFLGGFFLAIAATKYKLDINLARLFLKPFGEKPQNVMFGLMMITAIFSMFMSNTATTALMLAILAPVLMMLEADDSGRIAFTLCIPFAANIGGIGTPIGTPPNAVAMKYLTGETQINFAEWMFFGFPFAMIMLFICWRILLLFFPPKRVSITLTIKSSFLKSWQAYVVYFTFGLTIILWLTGFIHGMNSYVVAMIPVAVFVSTKIISAEDLKRISWDVLWLISGGIALGLALEKSGLSAHMIGSVPFTYLSPLVIVIIATLLSFTMSNFISNTATANLLLPLMAALGTSLPALVEFGGQKMLIIGVAFSCSFAMSFPVSTPPNAMAYATGNVKNLNMIKTGAIIGLLGICMIYDPVDLYPYNS